ncbi:hypothetical protein R5R35_002668 [Gryllus longicercus]|uniref:urocanate hydratase n=1 Tax=Gryllus longicercus TaxID=2509291 RepID=A0AAN9VZ65_9ORTH
MGAPDLSCLAKGLPTAPLPPPRRARDPQLPHAPVRRHALDARGRQLALKNALRYFPPHTHEELLPEFAAELRDFGHIYMYRFLPTFPVRAYPVSQLPARCPQAAAIMLMVLNNLDPAVAQYPEELVTYGGGGQVFSNWAQFWLTMSYLAEMDEEQTLVLYSGHPMGLFPSSADAPRAVITNGMVVPHYSSANEYDDMFALGVTMYGQMTAGSFCYIGPQGIVHGTTITLLGAGRRYLGSGDLAGRVFVTSGLGGMSGAQAKAAVIAGCIGVVAEVSRAALQKRLRQGWLMEAEEDLERVVARIRSARAERHPLSLGFLGNVVALWERLAQELSRTGERLVDLGSDQTSLHDPYGGGYFPVQLSYEDGLRALAEDPKRFKELVHESLRRQAAAVNALAGAGMRFWDYGNAFLLQASRAGADVLAEGSPAAADAQRPPEFRYPSYVQDVMGDVFSLGFGPFRWVCTSGLAADLEATDRLAERTLQAIADSGELSADAKAQYADNLRWVREAGGHALVVGSQARILYSDRRGRRALALAFNAAVADGTLKGPVVISRDHHDVSGTDSPFRETADIKDGSKFTADMAVQNALGLAARGVTWLALHNGGGVGWGESVNGGFGLVLDGSAAAARRAARLLAWDVDNGVARRAWAGAQKAQAAAADALRADPHLRLTLPHAPPAQALLDKWSADE